MFTIRKDRPTTWGDVERFVSVNQLPYTVFRFDTEGVLIDTATGDTLAASLQEAAALLNAELPCNYSNQGITLKS